MSAQPLPRAPGARRLGVARGALLTALPDGSVRYLPEALLAWDGRGRLIHAGPADRHFASGEELAGGPRALLIAAFHDPHVHLPQLAIAGRYHEPLLSWLSRRVFPEEARHRDRRVARLAARAFVDALIDAGTLAAGVLAAPFPVSAREGLRAAARRGLPLAIGPSLMDMGEPPELVGSTRRALDGVRRLLASEGGKAVALVPRFALSCTPALLSACGELARRHRARVLGHVSETEAEVEAVRLATGLQSYVEVYERARLLGSRTILAHGIHLTDAELDVLAFSHTWIAHCPTSNEALGSGRMPLERYRERGVRWCLASDVGAAPELSLLHVIEGFLRAHKGRATVSASEGYARATLHAAEALGRGEVSGALVPGRAADLLVVDEAPRRARGPESVVRWLLERGRARGWRGVFDRMLVAGHPIGEGPEGGRSSAA